MVSEDSCRKFKFERIHQNRTTLLTNRKSSVQLLNTQGREGDRVCLVAGRRYRRRGKDVLLFPQQHVERNNQRVQKVTNWKTAPETIKSDTCVCL